MLVHTREGIQKTSKGRMGEGAEEESTREVAPGCVCCSAVWRRVHSRRYFCVLSTTPHYNTYPSLLFFHRRGTVRFSPLRYHVPFLLLCLLGQPSFARSDP